jgi:hypothetical protein
MASKADIVPKLPRAQADSENWAILSGRQEGEYKRKGTGCQLCPQSMAGVEWSPVTTRTSGL